MTEPTAEPAAEPAPCATHAWGRMRAVHFAGGGSTHHVARCAVCNVHGRYFKRKIRTFDAELYASPLGIEVLAWEARRESWGCDLWEER